MSERVSKGLLAHFGEGVKELSKFVEYFDKLFDALNVRDYTSSIHSLKPFKMPYRSGNDFRLKVLHVCVQQNACTRIVHFINKWLKDTFIPWLDSWEKAVHDRKDINASEKEIRLLSKETSQGIRITGTHYKPT